MFSEATLCSTPFRLQRSPARHHLRNYCCPLNSLSAADSRHFNFHSLRLTNQELATFTTSAKPKPDLL